MPHTGPRPIHKARAMLAMTAFVVLTLAPSALAQHTYDVNRYHTYTSRSTWWPHATTTNNTASTVLWRVSYSVRRCEEWSGAVRLAREASTSYGNSACSTTSHSGSTSLAPYKSAALITRDTTNIDYYEIRKYDRSTRRLIELGYANRTVRFPEYTFSAHF